MKARNLLGPVGSVAVGGAELAGKAAKRVIVGPPASAGDVAYDPTAETDIEAEKLAEMIANEEDPVKRAFLVKRYGQRMLYEGVDDADENAGKLLSRRAALRLGALTAIGLGGGYLLTRNLSCQGPVDRAKIAVGAGVDTAEETLLKIIEEYHQWGIEHNKIFLEFLDKLIELIKELKELDMIDALKEIGDSIVEDAKDLDYRFKETTRKIEELKNKYPRIVTLSKETVALGKKWILHYGKALDPWKNLDPDKLGDRYDKYKKIREKQLEEQKRLQKEAMEKINKLFGSEEEDEEASKDDGPELESEENEDEGSVMDDIRKKYDKVFE